MSPPKMPSNITASHIATMLTEPQKPGTRSRAGTPCRSGLSVEGSCVITVVMTPPFSIFSATPGGLARPGALVITWPE